MLLDVDALIMLMRWMLIALDDRGLVAILFVLVSRVPIMAREISTWESTILKICSAEKKPGRGS